MKMIGFFPFLSPCVAQGFLDFAFWVCQIEILTMERQESSTYPKEMLKQILDFSTLLELTLILTLDYIILTPLLMQVILILLDIQVIHITNLMLPLSKLNKNKCFIFT